MSIQAPWFDQAKRCASIQFFRLARFSREPGDASEGAAFPGWKTALRRGDLARIVLPNSAWVKGKRACFYVHGDKHAWSDGVKLGAFPGGFPDRVAFDVAKKCAVKGAGL